MQIITTLSAKGGVAKTTTAAVLAQAAVHKGARVLAVDADPQANLSQALATRPGQDKRNTYSLLTGETRPADCIAKSGEGFAEDLAQGMDVIPAALDLATLTSEKGSARRLQKALTRIKKHYDLIVIDAPAIGGELQLNALQAATGLIIPVQADVYNMQSLYQVADLARAMQRSNPDLKIHGVIVTKYDGRTKHARQLREMIEEQARALDLPYLGEIRQSVAVQEAAAFMQSLYKYAPKSTAAADYMALYEKIMQD